MLRVLRLTSRLAGSIEKIFLPAHDGQGWCGFCSVCKRPLQAIGKVLGDFGMSHAKILDLVPSAVRSEWLIQRQVCAMLKLHLTLESVSPSWCVCGAVPRTQKCAVESFFTCSISVHAWHGANRCYMMLPKLGSLALLRQQMPT